MKRRARYKGRLTTVDDAAMADHNVAVICRSCGHERHMYAWKLAQSKARAPDIPLGVAFPGFYCRRCRRPVEAIVVSTGPFAG